LMQYDTQLQLAVYKLVLIWLNRGLITSKWHGFNKASTYFYYFLYPVLVFTVLRLSQTPG